MDRVLVIIYIAAICAANLSVAAFGPSVTPINAFLLIALDMALRDKLHDCWGESVIVKMPILIASAGTVSYMINPATGIIAIASLSAFAISSSADAAIYHAMRKRKWHVRANASNIVGAAIDSFVFPLVAFWSIMPEIVAWQFAAKVAGGVIFSAIFGLVKQKPQ
ncbi:MAG: VUT family protein [Shewanella sp.]